MGNFSEKFKKLQREPENIKRRYLVVFSAVAMVLIVGLWLFYLNLNLPAVPGGEEKVRVGGSDDSFFKVLGRGFVSVWAGLKNQFLTLKDSLLQGFDFVTGEFGKAREFSFERSDSP